MSCSCPMVRSPETLRTVGQSADTVSEKHGLVRHVFRIILDRLMQMVRAGVLIAMGFKSLMQFDGVFLKDGPATCTTPTRAQPPGQ